MGTNLNGYKDSQNKKENRAGHKPSSVSLGDHSPSDNDHSSRASITRDLKRPTRELGRATLGALLFGLAPGGVYRASGVTTGAGELLPHRFTLTPGNKASPRRFAFCGTFLPVTGTGRYPAPCPVELGLSSPPSTAKRQERSSDHLTYSILTPSNDTFLYLPPADHDLWPHWPVDLLLDSIRALHEK